MKEIDEMQKRWLKGKSLKKPKDKEPQTAGEWLRKAYIDHDPKDGAPKVGKIGYV